MKERITVKHDFEENWEKAVNFIPLDGELVIYDGIIENGVYVTRPRIKVGDGRTKINDLPFMFAAEKQKNYTDGNVLVIDGE